MRKSLGRDFGGHDLDFSIDQYMASVNYWQKHAVIKDTTPNPNKARYREKPNVQRRQKQNNVYSTDGASSATNQIRI